MPLIEWSAPRQRATFVRRVEPNSSQRWGAGAEEEVGGKTTSRRREQKSRQRRRYTYRCTKEIDWRDGVVSERETEWTLVVGNRGLIAAERDEATDCRRTWRWKSDRVMMPGEERRLENNGKDTEKRGRTTASHSKPMIQNITLLRQAAQQPAVRRAVQPTLNKRTLC